MPVANVGEKGRTDDEVKQALLDESVSEGTKDSIVGDDDPPPDIAPTRPKEK